MKELISRQELWQLPEYRDYSPSGIYKLYNRLLKQAGKPVGKRALLSIVEVSRETGMSEAHIRRVISE